MRKPVTIKLDEKKKKRKEKRNIVRMLRVTKARVNICINSLFVRRSNAACENRKTREKIRI